VAAENEMKNKKMQELKVDAATAEALLIQLIVERKLAARIDQRNGVLDLRQGYFVCSDFVPA